jgi:hypothetical protein
MILTPDNLDVFNRLYFATHESEIREALDPVCDLCGEEPSDYCCKDCAYCDMKVAPHSFGGRITCPQCGNSLADVNEEPPDGLEDSLNRAEVEQFNSHPGRM